MRLHAQAGLVVSLGVGWVRYCVQYVPDSDRNIPAVPYHMFDVAMDCLFVDYIKF